MGIVRASGYHRGVTVQFSPLTARRMLKLSLEKTRLLSVSLGPLMCRTLDHLLWPARTSAVRCSVRPSQGLQPGDSGWKAGGKRGRATRTPGPRAHKHWAAALLKVTGAQAAIGSDPGPRSARAVGPSAESATETSRSRACGLLNPSLESQRLRPTPGSRNTKYAAPSPRQPGAGTFNGVAHFLFPVRSKNASPPTTKAVPSRGTCF